MLDKVLIFITDLLNRNLKMSFGLTDDIVVPGSLINLDGSVTNNIENKVIISIINLEHEKTVKHMGGYIPDNQGDFSKVNPPVYLNLYLLISANYNSDNYLEALKMLSAVIGFFQASRVFASSDYPDLDSSIDRLTFEIYNVPIQELSHVWSGIGAKYVPSMVYKVRMVGIQKGDVKEQIPAVAGLKSNTKKE
ncbi:DUF4255 domain-containing protein [Flavivirga aquimarina]|uniref:DUF4255 domain-containing protein n=1 Tax=Flavivirga aquimarina TaxID=2027862 RepID=A0ABT8W781_9FLAO|nr:DUF4255 domain-containing protein [Flavivirga aquimarina]MDO5968956.1 DUF4255 domain-containing protein [Flavivirga aquimarina]